MIDRATPELVLHELPDPGIEGLESYSPFCLKVHRALAVTGLSYRRVHHERPAAVTAMNSTGQVPVLVIDGEPIADSTVILSRLSDIARAHGRPSLHHAEDR